MINLIFGACLGVMITVILIPVFPFILFILGFVDLGMNPTTPEWIDWLRRIIKRKAKH